MKHFYWCFPLCVLFFARTDKLNRTLSFNPNQNKIEMFWKKKKQHERMPSAVYIFGNKKRSELPMTH